MTLMLEIYWLPLELMFFSSSVFTRKFRFKTEKKNCFGYKTFFSCLSAEFLKKNPNYIIADQNIVCNTRDADLSSLI